MSSSNFLQGFRRVYTFFYYFH